MIDDIAMDLFSKINEVEDWMEQGRSDRISSIRTFVGKVVRSPIVGTGIGRYLAVNPVTILGSEIEGESGTLIEDTNTTIIVFDIGATIPSPGDRLVCRFIDHRWITRLDGRSQPSTAQLLGCNCTSAPLTLQMVVSSPACANSLLQSCTFVFSATPVELSALHLGDFCYLSNSMYKDPDTGDFFYYYLGCFSTIFRVSRVFPTSVYGSPFLDSVIFFWSLGLPGNSCDPFLLSNGQFFYGSNPDCTAVISE